MDQTTDTVQKRAPVWYITTEKSLIGNEMHEAGAKVQYDGLPAENLKPTCDEGRARYQEYLASNAERVARMIEANKESGVGDPNKFFTDFMKAQSENQTEVIAAAVAAAMAQAFAKLFPNGVPGAAPAPVAKKEVPAVEPEKDEPAVDIKKPAKG